eukprot:CAMPEP_0184395256 /NCGR_PEP_ID=MMETSP0007-20130409/43470_1 /TAXON_ID=97485 /ORGANISM="Prymnesium parvum, Strain Texoma1" /LENGTH=34 /DNA_ID= /DNA_START= /DNA_END= /DNA_ORIENTATION=
MISDARLSLVRRLAQVLDDAKPLAAALSGGGIGG